MEEIKKALQELAKAIESNPAIISAKVTFTLKKTNSEQGKPKGS